MACSKSGGWLVTINSAAENSYVYSLSPGSPVWIGFNDIAVEGAWRWQQGSSATYTAWWPGEPNSYGGNEDCSVMNHPGLGSSWADVGCGYQAGAVCETCMKGYLSSSWASLSCQPTVQNITDSYGGLDSTGVLVAGAAVTSAGTLNFTAPYQGLNLPSGVFGNYSSAVSIELWVSTPGYWTNYRWARLFQFGPAIGTNDNCVYVWKERNSGNIYMTTGNVDYASNVPFDSQTNMHVVLTMSVGNYVKLYVNGVLVITASYSLPYVPSPTYFYVGRWNYVPANEYFIGTMSEFRVWGGTLSAAEVLANFFAGTGAVLVRNRFYAVHTFFA